MQGLKIFHILFFVKHIKIKCFSIVFIFSFLVVSNSCFTQITRDYAYYEILKISNLKRLKILQIQKDQYDQNRFYHLKSDSILSLFRFKDGTLIKEENIHFFKQDSLLLLDILSNISLKEKYSSACIINCSSIVKLTIKRKSFYRVKIIDKMVLLTGYSEVNPLKK